MGKHTNNFKKYTALTTALVLLSSNAAWARGGHHGTTVRPIGDVVADVELPTGGNLVTGAGGIATSGSNMNISQDSKFAQFNFQTFNIGKDAGVNVNATGGSNASTLLNVTSNQVSSIRGSLTANDHLVLKNDAGVIFAGTSQVNVGSLVATTAKNVALDNAGNIASFSNLSDAPITVEDGANITAANGGLIALHAANVTNNGELNAKNGTVALTAVDGVTIDMSGNGKITYQPSAAIAQSIITNNGTINAHGGNVLINNQQAADIAQSVVNLHGVIDTSCLTCSVDKPVAGLVYNTTGGNVQVASAGDINTTARILANGSGTGTGGNITLDAGRTLTANGNDFQAFGGNHLNGIGKGGNIVMRGDNFKIAGSEQVGYGGVTEFSSNHDTHVTNDNAGTLNTISGQWAANQSKAGGNVIIDGHNVILDDRGGNTLQGGDGSIIFRTVDKNNAAYADGAVKFANKNDTIATRAGNIQYIAGGGGVDVGHSVINGDATHNSGIVDIVTVNGGNVTTGDISVQSPDLAPYGKQLTIASDGSVTINGKVDLYGNDKSLPPSNIPVNSSPAVTASITARNDVTLNGDVSIIAVDNYRPDINPVASLVINAGAANSSTAGNITTNGAINVNSIAYSSEGDVVTGIHQNTANAQLLAKGTVTATKNIIVAADSSQCIFPVTTNANLQILAANGDINTTGTIIESQAKSTITNSLVNAQTDIEALKGTASIGRVDAVANSTCCTGAPSGTAKALTIVYADKINFNGIDPFSTANRNITDNAGKFYPGQVYQGRVSGLTTDGTDVAEVRIRQNTPVVPPVTCQDNCTTVPFTPIVNLPPSTLTNLEPAAGNGNFCQNVNISSLPGLCYPEAARVVELEPAAGPIPFHFGEPVVAKKFASLKPKSGRCVNVRKPNGGKDVVCIKDEIDK